MHEHHLHVATFDVLCRAGINLVYVAWTAGYCTPSDMDLETKDESKFLIFANQRTAMPTGRA